MSNISTLNINGVDYGVGINMAPCKLVGTMSDYIASTNSLTIDLTTSDYDFLEMTTYSPVSDNSNKSYSFKLLKNSSTKAPIIYLTSSGYTHVIVSATSKNDEIVFDKNFYKNDILANVELYKYV